MPYDLLFDAIALLLWKLTELLPWARVLTRSMAPPQSPRSRSRDSRSRKQSSPAAEKRPRTRRGRLPWVHVLFGSSGSGEESPENPARGVRTLTQLLDAEVQERAALGARLDRISAQMESLIELVSGSERSLRRHSGSVDRQSPPPPPAPAGKDRRARDNRSSSSSSKRAYSSAYIHQEVSASCHSSYSHSTQHRDFASAQVGRREALLAVQA